MKNLTAYILSHSMLSLTRPLFLVAFLAVLSMGGGYYVLSGDFINKSPFESLNDYLDAKPVSTPGMPKEYR